LSLDVKDQNFDCLAVSRLKKQEEIKQMPCDQAVSFICSRRDKPAIPKLPFKIAKQYCENSWSKLIRFNESLPEKTEDNINYWVGTFRHRIFRH
ncbi:Hypothetical predicted protein, partial [Mytilus galloprovincialis]